MEGGSKANVPAVSTQRESSDLIKYWWSNGQLKLGGCWRKFGVLFPTRGVKTKTATSQVELK